MGIGLRSSEGGYAVLEAAFVTPVFLLLLLGAIEGGYALHERLSVDNMALAGARRASGTAADVLADYHVLQAMKGGAGGVGGAQITTIVVYKASGPGAVVPPGCRTASVAGVCNRYTGADLTLASSQFGCVGPPGPVSKIDHFWCPTTRRTALSGANGPPDHVGVLVRATHRNLTGILGTGLVFEADTILRIEPRTLT